MKSGDRIGHLILNQEGPRTSRRQRQWICQCDCGRTVIKQEYRLKIQQGLSCGQCYTLEFGRRHHVRPLDIIGQALATTWYPWAMDRARRWQRRWPGLEDEIESAAQYGLVLGVSRFNPVKSDNLERFLLYSVLTTIRREISNERRRAATPARLVLLLSIYTGIKISPSLFHDEFLDRYS